MRYVIGILFVMVSLNCYGQPAYLLHKSYGEKYFFVDSINSAYDSKNPQPMIYQLAEWADWAKANGDNELAGQLTLQSYRISMFNLQVKGGFDVNKLSDLYQFATSIKDDYLAADVLHLLGVYYWEKEKKYDISIEKYLTSYAIYKDYSSEEFPQKHEYLYDLGLIYYQYDDNDNSLKYLKEALKTPPCRKKDVNYAIYNTIGLCYRKQHMYDSALSYFKIIYDSAERRNERQWMGISGGNIGITYYYEGRYDEAIPLLEKDIQTGMTNSLKNTAKSMAILASIYYYRHSYDSAENLLQSALHIVEPRPFWPDYPIGEQIFTVLSRVYAAKNNMKLAYIYADSAILAKDSILAGNNALNLAKAQEQAEFLQSNLNKERNDSKKQIHLFQRNFLVSCLFLVMVIGVLIVNRQRLKRLKAEVEKKHAEAELNAASIKLLGLQEVDAQKKIVDEKNIELSQSIKDLEEAQAQLIQAEKMASLGQLTAGIAHEINNPINFVSASIEPLQKDIEDIVTMIGFYDAEIERGNIAEMAESVSRYKKQLDLDYAIQEARELLLSMEKGALRTAEIVRGLRNFSRLDENMLRLANLNEGIETTLTILYPLYKNRIRIYRDFGELPEIMCYPGQLNQVFMNVLSNAVQAMNGEGDIYVNTRRTGNFVKINIRDTGSGMTRETMSKIFDPFFTTKEIGKGTGLGLSITYGIVQKHKGKIEVFSEPGKGAEFIISIPVNQE